VRGVPPYGRPFTQPLWDGSPLNGRTILLHTEQGLGDSIQFVRYASVAKERGGRVVVECQPALVSLFARCSSVDQAIPSGAALPHFDVQAPNVAHRNDRNRSVALAQFAPLARVEGIRLVNLQKGPARDELRSLTSPQPVIEWDTEPDQRDAPFLETAAVAASLDLVITVDTAPAHLAGALGVPVWCALPLIPDWRWLLGRDDSPWYPTMRLFRQERAGDWAGVFERMADRLAHWQVD
jgi:hypothetical protein